MILIRLLYIYIYLITHLYFKFSVISSDHYVKHLFLHLHQARLMFWGGPFVCSSANKNANKLFWKRLNWFWWKLAQVVHGTRA